jgi:hypothetical protein
MVKLMKGLLGGVVEVVPRLALGAKPKKEGEI